MNKTTGEYNMDVMKKNNHQKDEIFAAFLLGTMEVVINVKAVHEVVNFPETIIQMPLAPDYLLGVFNLRGLIIPIINLKALLRFNDTSISLTQKVSIVEHEGAKVGLLFDSTCEILRIKPEEISDFTYHNENSNNVITGAIKLDSGHRILQIINPFSLLTIENIPQILDQQKKHDQRRLNSLSLHEKRSKCISFSIDTLKLGLDISGIHEIIKVTELQDTAIKSNLCSGTVNLRGITVPIIDLAVLLGMHAKLELPIAERRIIILKMENELFGFLVDSVESISTYLPTEIMPIPLMSKTRSQMFLGCISLDSLGDVIMLAHQSLLSNEDVLQVTHGHSKIYGSAERENQKSKVTGRRQSYISFKLDHHFGVSIKDIREIINYTEDIITAPGQPSFIKGILNLRGKLITVVDTRKVYGMDKNLDEEDKSKILIFESGEENIGLIVDSIESIISVDDDRKLKVPSLMVQKVRDRMQNDIKEIISFVHADKDCVLIVLDIEPICLRIKKEMAA